MKLVIFVCVFASIWAVASSQCTGQPGLCSSCAVGYVGRNCSAAPFQACFSTDWLCLYWTISGDSILAQMRGKTTGWMGIIVGPDDNAMRNGDTWWGYVSDSTNNPVFVDAWSSSEDSPARDNQQDFYNVTGYQTGAYTVINFERKLDTKDSQDKVIDSGWMKASLASANRDDLNKKHNAESRIAINFKSGEAKLATPDALVVAHGALMLVAWAFVGQVGPYLAFYVARKSGMGTGYFNTNIAMLKYHRYLAYFAVFLSIISFIIINVWFGPADPEFVSPHGVAGYIFFAVLLAQTLAAYFFRTETAKLVHRWIGRLILLGNFGFVMPSGMIKLWERGGVVGFVIIVLFWILTYIITACCHRNATPPPPVEMGNNVNKFDAVPQ